MWIYFVLNWCLFYWIFFSHRNWWTKPRKQRTYFWKKRQNALEKKLGCKFIENNTSNAKKDYDTDYEVSKLQTFISKFKEKNKTKRKQNKRTRRRNKKIKTSVNKLKCISCQKCFTKLQTMKNTKSKIKPIKSRKESRSNVLFGV